MLAAGVAPTEVAAVAIAGLGGGDAALLVGSTVVTVVTVGPVLGAFGADATISTALLTELVLVVALPLAAGITA